MKTKRQVDFPTNADIIVCIGICLILFFLSNTYQMIGHAVSFIFPCQNTPFNSFPCFGMYDLFAMGLYVSLIGIGLGTICVRSIKRGDVQKRKNIFLLSIGILILIAYLLFFPKHIVAPSSNGKILRLFTVEEMLAQSCRKDADCVIPVKYMLMSRCPFTSKCLQRRCAVICPQF